ncbi:hypothetical protein DPEC_G00325670 [Dallia pectoralis]|uniref:Uncharacterized protein n=1 Tax=Dallia pectoralis TaxID=75939 RepID=A0ACC2F7Y5_DALPE|nr:hypothetical protein DPEC_G00325670 [Dallia pectoralis]
MVPDTPVSGLREPVNKGQGTNSMGIGTLVGVLSSHLLHNDFASSVCDDTAVETKLPSDAGDGGEDSGPVHLTLCLFTVCRAFCYEFWEVDLPCPYVTLYGRNYWGRKSHGVDRGGVRRW